MSRCPSCGTEADSKFCPNCGTQISKEIESDEVEEASVHDQEQIVSEIPMPQTPPPTPQTPNNNQPNQTGSNPLVQTNQQKEPFYKKLWFCVLMVFLVPPIGIALMWVYKQPKAKVARIILTVLAALFIIIGIGSMGSTSSTSSTSQSGSTNTLFQSRELESISATYTGDTEAGAYIDSNNTGITVNATYSDGTTESVTGWSVDNPSELVASTTSDFTVSYQGKTCSLSITCTTIDEDSYKNSCEEIAYDDLARTPDDYIGTNVKFTGEVIQVLEDSSGTAYRINVTEGDYGIWDDTVLVYFENNSSSPRVLEDDIVTFYGMSSGLYTYESTIGASITVPLVYAEFIDIQ